MNNTQLIESVPAGIKLAQIPFETQSYKPLAHMELITNLNDYVNDFGLAIKQTKFQFDGNAQKMVGTFIMDDDGSGIAPSLVFRNSYDKSMSVGIGVGDTVFVCMNGMISADVVSLRKHTTNMKTDLDYIIVNQLGYLSDMHEQHLEDMEAMKMKQLSKSIVQELVGKMFLEDRMLTNPQMTILRTEMYNSENFKMFGTGGEITAWNMYNNITESLKKSHPINYTRDHIKAHSMVMELV